MSSRFDRVRPRTPDLHEADELGLVDSDGKRVLFSGVLPGAASGVAPGVGAVSVECSSCGVETALTLTQWLRAAVPSVQVPLLKRYPSYMRCPACARRTWLRPHFRG